MEPPRCVFLSPFFITSLGSEEVARRRDSDNPPAAFSSALKRSPGRHTQMRVLASAGAFLIAAMLLALHRLPIEKAALSLLEIRWHKADQLHPLLALGLGRASASRELRESSSKQA